MMASSTLTFWLRESLFFSCPFKHLLQGRSGASNHFEVATANQDASSGAALQPSARCHHGKGSKLDHEIDFNYGSRLPINSQ
jgi:hypothetical protein